jgi:protein-tyrosine phosphatase
MLRFWDGLFSRFRGRRVQPGNVPSLIDIHAHVLPGIDDGPLKLSESVELIRLAHAHGARTMIATPHMYLEGQTKLTVRQIEACFFNTVRRLNIYRASQSDPLLTELKLHLGAENYVCPSMLEDLARQPLLTLNGSRYLLIEFPPTLPLVAIRAAIERVLAQELVPVIAHVERLTEIRTKPMVAAQLARLGAVIQINSTPILRTSRTAKICDYLLNESLVHVVASDAHDTTDRRPNLSEVYCYLREMFGPRRARMLLVENPSRILEDRPFSELELGSEANGSMRPSA